MLRYGHANYAHLLSTVTAGEGGDLSDSGEYGLSRKNCELEILRLVLRRAYNVLLFVLEQKRRAIRLGDHWIW